MKIEIEISEEEINAALQKSVKKAVLQIADKWQSEQTIHRIIEKNFDLIINDLIAAEMQKSETIKQKIIFQIEANFKRKIYKLMEAK